MIDDLLGKIVAEKYRIESLLRDSDLGGIYRAFHVAMDKPVTVKVLSPAVAIDERYVDKFLAEAKTAAAVSHPNLLNVTDFGTDNRNITYIVYEGADGETLKELMKRDGALPVGQALSIAKQVAFGLAAAHAKGLTHGGLNPDKILFSKDEQTESVKVFDLGTQSIARTPKADLAYLAPEQYKDTTANDERSDIYSVGVILYEMLAGQLPFTGQTTGELKGKHEQEPPAPLVSFRSDLPTDLEPMILSALAADPERRYQKMESFAEDLQMLSGGAAVQPKAAAAVATGKRNIWQTAFIVMVGVFLLGAALIYFTSVRKTDPTLQTQVDPDSLPVQPIGPATGAQEESLAKLPEMTDAEMMAAQAGTMDAPPGTLPGGDGYNAWASGNGAPPIGAPQPGAPATGLPQPYQPPGGQTVTIDPNGGSQFMPQEGGVILVPVPKDANTAPKATPTPKATAGNTAVQPAATPKPMATPVPKTKPVQPGTKPSGKPKDSEL